VLLADTVGFVRRLPHGLVEAFQSTLAEANEADLLLHLVDGTDDDPAGQIAAVREVLHEIHANEIPELLVVNKLDALGPTQRSRIENLYPDAVAVSALTREGLDHLVEAVAEALRRQTVTLTLNIPYERGDIVAAAHRLGDVIEEKHDDNGTVLDVRVPPALKERFADFAD
jgi:GTP-binding protein HflX